MGVGRESRKGSGEERRLGREEGKVRRKEGRVGKKEGLKRNNGGIEEERTEGGIVGKKGNKVGGRTREKKGNIQAQTKRKKEKERK